MKIKKVTLFCGGSGSESIIKYFVNQKNVELTLLINAFDDGKSTGILRKYIPGLLGPSDFRKNFSYLFNLFSDEQRSLKKIFEYRFKKKKSIKDFYFSIKKKDNLNKFLPSEINFLEKKIKNEILDYLLLSTKYLSFSNINLINFSLGNLIFVGIFLREKNNFNYTIKKFAKFINTNIQIINISSNENRWLVAINQKNQIIYDESNLVEKKQYIPIKEIYLIEKKQFLYSEINKLTQKNKLKYLKKINSIPKINPDAKNNILKSDFIVYGPGTQHSSLFPSYLIASEYIKKSKAKKIMIMNLEYDNDIINLKTEQILVQALKYLKSEKKTNKVIDTVLVDRNCSFNNLHTRYKEIEIKIIDLRNNFLNKLHSGKKIFDEIINKDSHKEKKKLMIFINFINNSSLNIEHIDQLFSLNWSHLFEKLTIIVNGKNNLQQKKIPNIFFKKNKKTFPDTWAFENWYKKKNYEYLVTVSGDGYYDLSKILEHIEIMKDLNCGLLLGSRNQSRSQHFENIKMIYGKNKFLYFLSKISEFFFIIVYFLKLNFFLTDPNSGYRIYSKQNIKYIKDNKTNLTPSIILKKLVKEKTEVIEIPIRYYVRRNFSSIIMRFSQAIRNIKALYFN